MERVRITNGTIIAFITFTLVLAVAYFTRYILLVSTIGIGIGILISPVLNKLSGKLHFPRYLSAFLVLLLITLSVSGVLVSIYFLVADQFHTLTEKSPEIFKTLSAWFLRFFDRYPWLKDQFMDINIGQTAQKSVMNVFKGFHLGVIALGGASFAIILGLYTAVNSQKYYASTIEAFPPRHRDKASKVMKECGRILQAWFRAQLIDMLIIGTITALGLWITKVDYWAVFGLLTAVMGIIPYVGIILVVTTASLITMASDPGQVPWVLLVFGITQQLEGNVIIPLVMKDQIELPVVPLLVFMLILGSFFGILGVFIAPPTFAMFRALYLMIYLPYINNQEDPRSFILE